jgi:hypothetical protein
MRQSLILLFDKDFFIFIFEFFFIKFGSKIKLPVFSRIDDLVGVNNQLKLNFNVFKLFLVLNSKFFS